MKQLYIKEFKLNVKLPVYLLSLLGLMVMIPNYPVFVGVGYSVFQVFIYMQYMRENRSQEFSATLPVKRNDIVSSTTLIIVTLQMMNLTIAAIGSVIVRLIYASGDLTYSDGNIVGIIPNFAFFGLTLLCLAVFNLIFITGFFKTGYKYGVPIIIGALTFIGMFIILDAIEQLIPALNNALDTYATKTLWARLVVLAVGIAAYCGCTFAANRIAQKRFEKVSL